MAPRIPVPSFALRGLKPGSLSRALTLRLALAVLILTSMVAGGAAWISISQERRGLEQEAHALVQNLITSLTTPVWELDERPEPPRGKGHHRLGAHPLRGPRAGSRLGHPEHARA